jgi:hypothetical protein
MESKEIRETIRRINTVGNSGPGKNQLQERLFYLLTKNLKNYPEHIDTYYQLFLLYVNVLRDYEEAMKTAMKCYKCHNDQISIILWSSIEEVYRGGIDKKLVEMIRSVPNDSPYLDIFLFYESMYLKSNGLPYEEKLKEVIVLNNSFVQAYIELSKIFKSDSNQAHQYIRVAISKMTLYTGDSYDFFDLDLYFREVIYLNSVSKYQLEYFESLVKE